MVSRAFRACQDDETEAGQGKRTNGRAAPLSRRDPGVVARKHQCDEGDIRRVENVFAAHAQQKLAADRYAGGKHCEQDYVRAQQQGQ